MLQEIFDNCGKDIILLGKTIAPKTYYRATPKFHERMGGVLSDTSIRQASIEAPRGTAKSTLCVSEVERHLIYDEGDKVVVIQSKTRREAIRRLTKLKNTFDYNYAFRELYGYWGEEKADAWREDELRVRTKYGNWTIIAIGTGQQARGILEDDTRITLYYLDDPQDEDNCVTVEQMQKDFDKFLGNLAGLDMRNGRVRIVGTPVRAGCIVERIRNMPGWTTLQFKNHQEDGTLLWEEMYSEEWLDSKKEELKAMGKLSKYYSEYECEIVGDEDQLFREEDFRYYDGEFQIKNRETFLKIGDELKPINVFLGIDPASSVKQSADYSVIMPVGFDENKNIYVLDYFRQRVNPLVLTEAIVDFIKRYNPVRGHIESIGFQEMLRQSVRQRLKEENLHLAGLEVKFNPRTEKSARLETLQPFFAQHRIFIKESMKDLIDELLMYPRGKHDDMIDGLYYATRKLITPDHTLENTEFDEDTRLVIDRGGKLKELGWRAA